MPYLKQNIEHKIQKLNTKFKNWTQNSKIKLNILSPSISNCSTVPIRSALEAVPGAGPGLASQVQYILRFQYSKVSTSKVKSQQTFLSSPSARVLTSLI